MMYGDIRELHAMIADAVKEGILAAYKEMNMDRTEDAFENAKTYCERLKSRFSKYSRLILITDFTELVIEMKKILTADECRYVVTHIHAYVGNELFDQADAFVRAYAISSI